jgi:mRNA-degrading endonuclease YafQ of YafQ-DinJ toxin-antitoxin module
MPKPKKRSAAGAAAISEARSKKLYSAYLDEDLRAELRSWPKRDRARVGRLNQRVQENFGSPHLHSGTGIRDLSPKGSRLNVYECRIGKGLRLVFTLESPALLYFHTIGNHDEVRRFLKSLL